MHCVEFTHPLTPSAREGESLDACFASLTNPADCHESTTLSKVADSRNDKSLLYSPLTQSKLLQCGFCSFCRIDTRIADFVSVPCGDLANLRNRIPKSELLHKAQIKENAIFVLQYSTNALGIAYNSTKKISEISPP